jgi:cation diffusion facilitator family transporter
LFVKNYEQTEDTQVRTRYGLMASVVCICCNVLLFGAKMAAGLLTHSIAIMADAFNNLSDAASSIISFVGVKMAGKPADEDHPFGHGRIEYIAAFVVAFLVIQVGFSLLKSSIGKILHPEEMAFQMISVVILALSICVKLWMGFFNRRLGRRIDSKVMMATAADAMGDVCATSATLASLIVFGVLHFNIDGIVGLIVSVLVLIAGINIAKDTLAPLIGEPISPEVYRKITQFVESYNGIAGSHDLIVHNYGPGRSMASIHAEVPKHVDIETSHEIVDRIEHDIYRELGIFLVIHMDPIDLEDEHVVEMKAMAEQVLKEIDERLSLHDFRVVNGTSHVSLIFDLVVPHEYTKEKQEALKKDVGSRIRGRDQRCACVITTEYGYVEEQGEN